MSTNYAVLVEHFAERHYIKNFEKKYKCAWYITWSAVVEELKRLDSLALTSIAEKICGNSVVSVYKIELSSCVKTIYFICSSTTYCG